MVTELSRSLGNFIKKCPVGLQATEAVDTPKIPCLLPGLNYMKLQPPCKGNLLLKPFHLGREMDSFMHLECGYRGQHLLPHLPESAGSWQQVLLISPRNEADRSFQDLHWM